MTSTIGWEGSLRLINRNRLFLAILFSFLSVANWESVAYADFVVAPKSRITRIEEVVDQGGNTVKRKFVSSQDDLLETATEFMGSKNVDDWIERKPDFFRSPDGKLEIEISSGHPHMGEGPHVKIVEFDPTKGKRVVSVSLKKSLRRVEDDRSISQTCTGIIGHPYEYEYGYGR